MPEIIFNGPEGRLEGRYHHNPTPGSPIAVVLHPHPLYGGTMNNKIVYRIYQAFAQNGFSVLRFNFRGVGRSLGRFDDGIGELSDAAAALDWIQVQNPDASTCWVGGFSFGAWISMQLLMRRPEIEGFMAVSPPANLYDFSFLSPCPASGYFAQGGKDDIVKMSEVNKLVDKLRQQKYCKIEYQTFDTADHYFRTNLDDLDASMNTYLQERMDHFRNNQRVRPDKKRRQLLSE
jgi:alpha/beta superfamily hydrolase